MINIETLLSSFDERGTLLKWLKAVEKALNEATLTSVDVITISSTEIKLKFIFEDDTTIETPTITLPKGDKGDTGETGATGQTGATGVGISNVTIDANNHLIVTLTDETEIDAGEIDVTSGIVVDSAISNTSENPVQNKVIYNALNSKASQADLTALTTRVGNVEGDIGTIEAQLTNKANASDVYTKTEANNLLAGKQNALTTTSVPDGTIDKSIGFDSQGNVVKGSAGGGGGVSEIANGFTVKVISNYHNSLTFYDKNGNTHTGTGTFNNINYIEINGMLWSDYQIITGAVIAYIVYHAAQDELLYFNRPLLNFPSPDRMNCSGYFIPLSDLTINNTGD